MTSIEHEFFCRIAHIPQQGIGLSIDRYAPDLYELVAALEAAQLQYDYLEIFKTSKSALTHMRGYFPRTRFQYHAEGIWVTQPGLETSRQFKTAFTTAAVHLATLGSHWMTHECASKQMAGYSFGTYLPPLYTKAGADVTAYNARLIQQRIAASGLFLPDHEPLVLLEIPPLIYCGFGDLSTPDFFRRVVAQASCGLVLDIGHVWTIYRYTGEWRRRSLQNFFSHFLDEFPLERIVQIHIAGLNVHPATKGQPLENPESNGSALEQPPLWIDAHDAPIPEVLWDMLAQVLSHPGLIALKGIALEVDTKPIQQILTEYEGFRARFGNWTTRTHRRAPVDNGFDVHKAEFSDFTDTQELSGQYDHYAQIMTDRSEAGSKTGEFLALPVLGQEHETLDMYRRQYLPYEIIEWGGNLRDMFPCTSRELDNRGIPLSIFVDHWFREQRSTAFEYDFFLLKIERFVEFVRDIMPDGVETACREANELREAYQASCDEPSTD